MEAEDVRAANVMSSLTYQALLQDECSRAELAEDPVAPLQPIIHLDPF